MSGERGAFDQALPPGTTLSGIYEVGKRIGHGGMGEVYRGRMLETGDSVAIKVLKADYAGDPTALALFRKEASALHHLHHEAIVRYFVFTVEPVLQRPYLAMELVEGPSLADLLKNGPLGLDAARVLMRRVASGLQAAHERGVVHRDISPDNIILPGGDPARARIIDFGIAKSGGLGGETVIGEGFAGKYGYVSPEQLGLFGGTVTPRSDIYSLGLVVAQSLRGRAVDMGRTQADVLEKRRSVPDLADVDERIRPLLAAMLQPDPDARPRSMAEIVEWTPVAARPLPGPSDSGSGGAPRSRDPEPGGDGGKRRGLAISAVLGLLLLAGGAYVAIDRFVLAPPAKKPTAEPTLDPGGSTASPSGGQTAEAPKPEAPPLQDGQASAPAPQPAVEPAPVPPKQEATAPPLSAPSPQSTAAETSSAPPSPEPQKPTASSVENSRPAPQGPTPKPDLSTIILDPPAPASPPPQQPVQPTPQPVPADVAKVEPAPSPSAPPASTVTTPPSANGSTDRVQSFLDGFRGGPCFFVQPVDIAGGSARLEGYGSEVAPFQQLDREFTAANGFEAKITVGKVEKAQCPAVDMLARIGARERGKAPRIELARDTVRLGDILTGTLEAGPARYLDLILVRDDGTVQSMLPYVKTKSPITFGMPIDRAPAASKPQLLVAVSSDKPLPALDLAKPVPADRLFAALQKEIATDGNVSIGARLFRIEK
jgi:serine/threonine-protein kinase